ncbi:thyroid receptor-interacting protein 11-like isoform X2 [Copidosoma floridanum]|uniref:thyroid receptor-interacting protein 11-like isoform X2 n=1 Tax=Copidosoma floridanum TaxID=29053 RepID=UPI0006C9D88F|nr:thyroid receptor-interacting protein 11-like isoform X2 [Copidosoma floridanum]
MAVTNFSRLVITGSRSSHDSTSSHNNGSHDEDGAAFFWDPQPQASRSRTKLLQDQLDQATLRIRDLESELALTKLMDPTSDAHHPREEGVSQRTEMLRAKQDVTNRIIQIGEKGREVERSAKRLQQNEQSLAADFRAAISKLASAEQYELVSSALRALETESREFQRESGEREKSDSEIELRSEKNKREDELRRRLEELEADNRTLAASMEELDRQNAESIERVLSLKEELQKKHHSLQSAYEHLYVDYNQALGTIETLQQQNYEPSKPPTKESLNSAVQTTMPLTVDQETEVTVSKEDKGTEATVSKEDKGTDASLDNQEEPQLDASAELRKVQEVVKNSSLQIPGRDEPSGSSSEDSLFVSLAKSAVELKWQRDALEHKFTGQCRELKDSHELRDALQMDCEDLQQNVESLLVEVQRLKSNLPSIPEASEERVASLETETESLQAEVRSLREINAKMSRELRAIREAVRDSGAEIDVAARIEALLTDREHLSRDDPAEMLRVALDENVSLRRRVDAMESELRVSVERCKGIDENLELIEELKLDVENARRELKIAASSSKRLENSLNILQEAKIEVDTENEVLAREKEQLEADLRLLRDSDLKHGDAEALAKLRDELTRGREEKDDLEYDLMKMRQELDRAFVELELARTGAEELRANGDRLARENAKLQDQFAEAQAENQDKLELLNTEMSLLKQELDGCREELESALEARRVAEERVAVLDTANKDGATKMDSLEVENRRLTGALDESTSSLGSTTEKLRTSEERNSALESENTELKSENQRLVEKIDEMRNKVLEHKEEIGRLEEKLKCAETYRSTTESELAKLKVDVMEFRSSGREIISTQLQAEPREVESNGVPGKIRDEADGEDRPVETVDPDSRQELMSLQLAEKSKEIEELRATMAKDKESVLMARETVENLSQLISAKDAEIAKTSASHALLSEERGKLVQLVQEKHSESLQYHAEIQRLTHLLGEQNTKLQKITAERDAGAAALQEKETQLLWTQNEMQVLRQRLQEVEEAGDHVERCSLPEHSVLGKRTSELEEKNKALEAAVIQDQTNMRYLQEQLVEAQSKESAALKEVERLRNHLVEIEANYTEEALQTEEIRNALEARLVQAEEKLKNSSTMYTSASVRANQQVETLQQQLALIVQQRDDLQNKISAAEDKVLSYTASLTNLQLVLEQFQRDKEKDIQEATTKLRAQLQDSYREQEALRNDIINLKAELLEAKDALKAASRLTEELGKKSERIEELGQEVNKLTELVNTADQRIEEAKKSGEGKVDKTLIKNLLLGYISSPANDKLSVLRVCANVLDFNKSEREKSGLDSGSAKNSWFASLVNSGSSSGTDQEASLSTAFIRFLENESQPKVQLPAMQLSNSPINRPGHSRQHSSSSTQSSLLLTNINLPTFPDFVPARNTGSILKEVLKDS